MNRDHVGDDASDVLLLELTHRFFNSLQIIGALVAQAEPAAASERHGRAPSGACRELICAVSDYYRRLSRPLPSPADLEEHCSEVLADLIRIYASKPIRASLYIEPQDLSGAREGRLVLLMAELVTNALKHALADGGRLYVGLSRVGPNHCELAVADASPGPVIQQSLSPPRIASLLTTSIDGSLTIYPGPRGRIVQVVVPLDGRTQATPHLSLRASATAA